MAYAEIHGGEIRLTTHWSEKDQVKQVPGSGWNDKDKFWHVPLTWAACLQLRGIFQDRLTLGPKLRTWARMEKKHRVQPCLELRDRTVADDSAYNPKLYDFQKAGVRFLSFAGSALLGDEMGTGKTIQTLETLRMAGDALPAVVVCPKSMKGTWAREARIWFPDASVYIVEGAAGARRKTLLAASQDPKALVVINFEGVRGHSRMLGFGSTPLKRCKACDKTSHAAVSETACETHPKELNAMAFRSVIVDEAHRLKDPNAKQTRSVWALGQGASVTRRIALTGTPLAKNPGDLWAIMHFVSPAEYPTKSKYVSRYCAVSFNPWGGLEIAGINTDNEKELFGFFDPRFRRMPKALVLPQLPPKVSVKRFVQLDGKQRKAYDQLAAGLITRLDDDSLLVAKSDLTAQTRLLQFSSSYMERGPDKTNSDGEIVPTWLMRETSPKLDAMEEIMDEMGDKPVVVCAESRQLIEMAEKRVQKAGISYAMITGNTPQWDREAQLKEFQEGKRRVMLFTIKAGGVGLTMTAADTIIFLQRSWSMIDNRQAEDRVHRIGSEIHEWITVIDVIAEDTIEETQIARLWIKRERMEEINRDRAKLIAAGLPVTHLDKEESMLMSANLGDPL